MVMEHLLHRISSLLSLLLLLWGCRLAVGDHETAPECEFPAIFNFGDSNSDTGGLSAVFGQAGPPHGESFFNGPAGRYCDGRLLVDFIAEGLGLPYLSAFLDSIGSNFSHGANFATAGSTIRPENVSIQLSGFSPISLGVQWNEFHDFHIRSQKIRDKGGVFADLMPHDDYFSKALYTFDIGQNDLTEGYFNNKTVEEVRAEIPDILKPFKDVVSWIYGIGGRSFWVHNTGPVGCLPYVMDSLLITAGQVDNVGCASPFNDVARDYNDALKSAIDELRHNLPQAAITYVDIYSIKYALFSQARKYGLSNPLRTCCGHGGKYNYNRHLGCGATKVIKGEKVVVSKACKDPSKAVVWDGVHFTQAANRIMFDNIVDGSLSSPAISLKMACHRNSK